VCVFDAKGRTFRDDWYGEYKATRTSMPEPLAQQIGPIHEVVKLLGWPVLEVPGIEADDAIGTLACIAEKAGHSVIISTGDKDLAQLVTDNVTLINTMSNEKLDVEAVKAKFGVPPERIVDYLTLVGDSIDNIPGVEKVGPKTAARWIIEHGSLEGVMAAAPSIKGVAGENLRKALDWLPTGRKLVTIIKDCELANHVPAGLRSRIWPCATWTTPACTSSTSATAFATGSRNSKVQPAARLVVLVPPRPGRSFVRGRPMRRRWCASTKPSRRWSGCRPGSRCWRPRHSCRSRRRRTRWTRCRRASSAWRLRSSRGVQGICPWPTVMAMRRRSCRWPTRWRCCHPGLKTPIV
jgi:hypothetical protein